MIAPEKIVAYVDGEVDAAERAEIEAAIAADPALAAKIEAHRALSAKLARVYAPIAEAAAPQHLVDTARAPSPAPSNVVPFSGARRGTIIAAISALAASFVIGLVIGGGMQNAPIVATADGLLARGALARALETQLASETDAGAPIQIGLTFRTQDGDYCRTFRARSDEGLACRDNNRWRVELAARTAPDSQYRMAGTSPAVLQAVEQRIVGEPLDEDAERSVRDAGWRAAP